MGIFRVFVETWVLMTVLRASPKQLSSTSPRWQIRDAELSDYNTKSLTVNHSVYRAWRVSRARSLQIKELF